jgi:ABC-type phosphate/phosphonate transport system substrate-binding protein
MKHQHTAHWLFCFCLSLATMSVTADSKVAAPNDSDTTHIGIMSRLMFSTNRIDTRIATEMLFLDFMQNIGRKGVFTNYDNPEQVITEMRNHRLDAVLANTLDYLMIDHLIDKNKRYTVTFGSDALQEVILLTRRSDMITDLEQLRNKRLTYPAGFKIGLLFLDVALLRNSLPAAEQFFSASTAVVDLNTAIIDLFFEKADAALVTDASFRIAGDLNSQISRTLEVSIASEPIIPMVIGISKSVPSEITDKVDEMVEHLVEYPRTIHLLSLFKADRVVKISDKDLRSARALKQQYDRLLSLQGNR